MKTAGLALTLFAALLFAPTLIQRARRAITRFRHAESFAEQARLDVLDLMSKLTRMRQERDEALLEVDYWRNQYHGGVDAIIDRLRAAVQDEDTPTHDAVVLDWLDENTGWSA